MRYSSSLLFAASASAAVLELGLTKARPAQGIASPLKRRQGTSTYLQTLINNVTGGGYYTEVAVGTPPQPQLLIIDTGSSDTWVVASDADLCTSARLQATYGDSCGDTYDSSASSTYKLVTRGGFDIEYLDGSTSAGDYFTDNLAVGGATLESLQMGYATEVVRGTGIMGVSYAESESTTEIYPNIMDVFVSQGLVATKSYSLYLNDYHSDTGTILFGGVDTEKFIGTLVIEPILKTFSSSGNSSHSVLAIALTDMVAETTSQQAVALGATAVPAILDSGTTLSYLPSDMAESLFSAVDAYTDSVETGYTFIDCEAGDLTLTLTFGDATIVVPREMVVLDVFSEVQDQIPRNVPFARSCLFGFQDIGSTASLSSSKLTTAGIKAATSNAYALLGDTFLRSAYVVYDMTNNEIGLAQSNLNSTTSNVIELAASPAGLPTTLTGVKAQQTTNLGTATATATSTGTGTSSNDDTVTVTASPGVSAGRPSHGSPASVVAVLAVCAASFFGGALLL